MYFHFEEGMKKVAFLIFKTEIASLSERRL